MHQLRGGHMRLGTRSILEATLLSTYMPLSVGKHSLFDFSIKKFATFPDQLRPQHQQHGHHRNPDPGNAMHGGLSNREFIKVLLSSLANVCVFPPIFFQIPNFQAEVSVSIVWLHNADKTLQFAKENRIKNQFCYSNFTLKSKLCFPAINQKNIPFFHPPRPWRSAPFP